MERDPSSVDPKSFYRVASLQCVHTSNATAVARALELLHYQPANVPQDLADIDPHELPCLVATVGGWTYVFGHALGLKSARALSAEFGEALALHIDEPGGTYRCERARDGEVIRRVYASVRDGEADSQGEPGPGEPQVDWLEGPPGDLPLGLSAADVLRFARAWGADPYRIFKGTVPRAFVASRNPIVTRPRSPKRSVIATLFGSMMLLALVGGIGWAVWWLAQSDQGEVAYQLCENQWSCSGCVGCTASSPHPCAEAFHACADDAGCVSLMQCFTNCQDLGTRAGFTAPGEAAIACFAECRTTHAAGLDAYCDWTECSYRQACASLCTDPGYLALAACQ